MKISEALDTVYTLAKYRIENNPEATEEEQEALDLVHDFIVNHMAEGEEWDDHYSLYPDMVNIIEAMESWSATIMTRLRAMREAYDVELQSHSSKGSGD